MPDNHLTPNDLKERNRLIFELSQQFTYAEVARQFGLSRERVRTIATREAKKQKLLPDNLRNSRKNYDIITNKVLHAIKEIQSQYGYPPSQEEISLMVGVPQPRISRLLHKLKKQGVLKPLRGARLYIINQNLAPQSTTSVNAEMEEEEGE